MMDGGLRLAGHGYPARVGGVGLATDGLLMRSTYAPMYPVRAALSVSYRGAVVVGVTE